MPGSEEFTYSNSRNCSHEIKRQLLLGRKVMTNLDSIFKGRDRNTEQREKKNTQLTCKKLTCILGSGVGTSAVAKNQSHEQI